MKTTIFIKIILLIALCVSFSSRTNAQTACDNLYAKAVQFQQKMTISSQNQAISYFQKAMACYDSEAKKNLCSSQIATCRNTIALIKKNNAQDEGTATRERIEKEIVDSLTAISRSETKKKDTEKVVLDVSESVVKFKAKGGEFKKIKVTCNFDDWAVTEHPDWIAYSISKDNEIVLEAYENPTKEERTGMVKVECRGTIETFAVLQAKKSMLTIKLK